MTCTDISSESRLCDFVICSVTVVCVHVGGDFADVCNHKKDNSSLNWNSINQYPGARGFLLILSFLFWNLGREALIEAPSREKRKPLVKIVENLTFMLAQHLTAVKDVIFFWPITKGDLIYNLLTGPGGSVLRYSEINYFVGRGEERLPCLQAVKLPGSCFHS